MTRQSIPCTYNSQHQKQLRHLLKLEIQKKNRIMKEQKIKSLTHHGTNISSSSSQKSTTNKLKSILKTPRHSNSNFGSKPEVSTPFNFEYIKSKDKICKKVVFGAVEMTTIPHRLDCEEYDFQKKKINVNRIDYFRDRSCRIDLKECDNSNELKSRADIDSENLNFNPKVEQEFQELLESADEMQDVKKIGKQYKIMETHNKELVNLITIENVNLCNYSKLTTGLKSDVNKNEYKLILKDQLDSKNNASKIGQLFRTNQTPLHASLTLTNKFNLQIDDRSNDGNIIEALSTKKRKVQKEQETNFLIDQTAYEARLARLRLLGVSDGLTQRELSSKCIAIYHESPLAFYENETVLISSENNRDVITNITDYNMELESNKKHRQEKKKFINNTTNLIDTLDNYQNMRQDINFMILRGIKRKKKKNPTPIKI